MSRWLFSDPLDRFYMRGWIGPCSNAQIVYAWYIQLPLPQNSFKWRVSIPCGLFEHRSHGTQLPNPSIGQSDIVFPIENGNMYKYIYTYTYIYIFGKRRAVYHFSDTSFYAWKRQECLKRCIGRFLPAFPCCAATCPRRLGSSEELDDHWDMVVS